MAKMKIEVLAARNAVRGVPLRERVIAELPRTAPFAAMAPFLFNLRNRIPALARLMERTLGISAARELPPFRHDAFHDAESPVQGAAPADVILFADTFNRAFEPENLRAALRVLAAAGQRVRVATPDRGMRPLCCGRTYLAAGMVERARAEARRTLAAIGPGETPVIGLEPSCLLTLRDEFPALLPGPETAALAKRAMLLSEWIERTRPALKLKPLAATAHIHGHCHQKAQGAFPDAVKTLRQIPELSVKPIASSCCGMAGAFGYDAAKQEVSRAMAELSLLPTVRAAPPEDLIVADGTSCRHQIAGLSGREAVHSVRVLERALA
jgi:Fe-S oxidoreductase